METQPPPAWALVYLRPSDPARTAIVEYADHFQQALQALPGGRLLTPLAEGPGEEIGDRAARDAVLDWARAEARRLDSEFPAPMRLMLHAEIGNALHREFWAAWALARALPRARLFATVHDPPKLCSNPYRYVPTEFEGRTPLRPLNVLLTKTWETAVARRKARREAEFCRRLEAVAALSHGGADTLRNDPRIDPSHVRQLPHVYDGPLPPLEPETEDPDPLISFLGYISPGRGIEELIEAFAILCERLERGGAPLRPRLQIFGGVSQGGGLDEYLAGLRRRVKESPWAARIRFAAGFVDDATRDRLMAPTRVRVLPYRTVQGSVFSSAGAIQALAQGRAVVAADSNTLPEVVRHEKTGLLYPETDTTALAARLERLLREPALRQKLAHAARQAIEHHHLPRAVAARLPDFYGLSSLA